MNGAPRIGLLQAVDDPHLLGATITPFPRQRDLLASIDAGPRIHVLCLGRRSSKTTTAALCGVHNCTLRPDLDAGMPTGITRYAAAVATNLQQARLFVAAARAIVEASPVLSQLLESSDVDELRFRLPSGHRTALKAFPCSSRGSRGFACSMLLFDEMAFMMSETEGPQVADAVFKALTPSTAQFGDTARIIVASTPYGTDNLFAQLFHRAQNGELQDAKAYHATTAEMNPTVTAEFLDGMGRCRRRL